MIKFILNNTETAVHLPAGDLLLDFIRYQKHFTGTKIGCREGDCGACTVLVGELKNNNVQYCSFTSCLTPLGNVHGKHVVTIEGINANKLTPVQQAMSDCSATQCGFCTPGFVMSLSGYCLSNQQPCLQAAVAAIDGNICRCTGYKSIERAAAQVTEQLLQRNGADAITYAVEQQMVPAYFSTIKQRLQQLQLQLNGEMSSNTGAFVGGGTDLYVQRHTEMKDAPISFTLQKPQLKSITQQGGEIIIGSAVTVTDMLESPLIQQIFPDFAAQVKLVSSTLIRNMATMAGNLVNASPIGDFSIFFLALNATLTLNNGHQRKLPLRQFYKGYKVLDKHAGEYIEEITFSVPANFRFNFEKVSKRTHLDIASVNSAMLITEDDGLITSAGLAGGGLAPIPLYLKKTSEFLTGKKVSETLLFEALEVLQTEISPISDARGTAGYKRLLMNQLLKAHFLHFFKQLNRQQVISYATASK